MSRTHATEEDPYWWRHEEGEPCCECTWPSIWSAWPLECRNCHRRLGLCAVRSNDGKQCSRAPVWHALYDGKPVLLCDGCCTTARSGAYDGKFALRLRWIGPPREEVRRTWRHGSFVRVLEGHPTRGGKDGMVVQDLGNEVALIFHRDRHDEPQDCVCEGRELWAKDELDLDTLLTSMGGESKSNHETKSICENDGGGGRAASGLPYRKAETEGRADSER